MSLRYNWLNSNQADRRLLSGVFGNGGKHVTFAGLTTSDPVTTYSENGYTITTVSAAWTGAERLIFYTQPSTTTVGEIRMTADDGGTFLFNAVDLYSSLTVIPFVIEGRLGSATVFSFSDTLPQTSGAFVRVHNPQLSDPIDTLVIRMTNTASACCANPMGLDIIQTLRPSLP
jgi:hypothetical protein